MSVYFAGFHLAQLTSLQNFGLKTTTCLFSFRAASNIPLFVALRVGKYIRENSTLYSHYE